MLTKEEELIEQNNELRDQLNETNKKYYEDFLVYVRLRSFLIEEETLEEQLLQILQDILDAQKDGLSAEQFYGSNPKVMANELLESFQKKPLLKTGIKWFSYTFGLLSFYFLLQEITRLDHTLSLSRFLASGIMGAIGIFALFFFLSKSIYTKFSKLIQYIICVLFFSLLIGSFLLIDHVTKDFLTFIVPPSIVIVLALIILVSFTFGLIKQNKEQSLLFTALSPYIYFSSLFSILYQLNVFSHFSDKMIKTILAVGVTLGLLFFLLLFNIETKKKKK